MTLWCCDKESFGGIQVDSFEFKETPKLLVVQGRPVRQWMLGYSSRIDKERALSEHSNFAPTREEAIRRYILRKLDQVESAEGRLKEANKELDEAQAFGRDNAI